MRIAPPWIPAAEHVAPEIPTEEEHNSYAYPVCSEPGEEFTNLNAVYFFRPRTRWSTQTALQAVGTGARIGQKFPGRCRPWAAHWHSRGWHELEEDARMMHIAAAGNYLGYGAF